MRVNVVSFFAPRADHPLYQDYRPFLALLKLSCERFGHRHVCLTDDPSQDDAYVVQGLPGSLMPAFVQAQYAYLSDPALADVPTLLTGADCVLASDPVAAFGGGAYDIGITTDDRFQDCRMNTGAIFIPHPGKVARVWADAMTRCGDTWGDDQRSIYAAILASGLRVREFPCDPYNLAPVTPSEDCSRGMVLHFRGPRKRWMIDYCHKHLGLGGGVTVQALPNATSDEALENVRLNCERDLPWIDNVPAHDRHAVLVGGGPSLAETLDEIWRRQFEGQDVFALNGVAEYLAKHGFMADYGVILDPRADNARFVMEYRAKRPVGLPKWLLASQCHPDVFDAARNMTVEMWHFATDGMMDVLPRDATLIGGGLTVGLTAMGLVYAMGYRKIHLYGYDSSDRIDASHAYDQAEDIAERKRVEVWHEGRRYVAGIAMYAQAEAFPRWAGLLAEQGATITVHGDGLLPAIAHTMQLAAREELAA